VSRRRDPAALPIFPHPLPPALPPLALQFQSVVSLVGPSKITDEAVSLFLVALLGTTPPSSSEGHQGWSFEHALPCLVDAKREEGSGVSLDWEKIIKGLDQPDWTLADPEAFGRLARAIAAAHGAPFPLAPLLSRRWGNHPAHLAILRAATTDPDAVFRFYAHNAHKVEGVPNLVPAPPPPAAPGAVVPASAAFTSPHPLGGPSGPWSCPDLLDMVGQLADAAGLGWTDLVASGGVLAPALAACPEVLLVCAAYGPPSPTGNHGPAGRCTGDIGPLQRQILLNLLPAYFTGHPNSRVLLRQLWSLRRNMVVKIACAAYIRDPSQAGALVDAFGPGGAGLLDQLLEAVPLHSGVPPDIGTPSWIALDLACAAARREYLNLAAWLGARCRGAEGAAFARESAAFLADRLRSVSGDDSRRRPRLTAACRLILMRTLTQVLPQGGPDSEPLVRAQEALAADPDEARPREPEPRPDQTWPDAINTEANELFDQIFHGKLTIPDATRLLGDLGQTADARPRQVRDCMVQSLLDEFAHFQEYPDRERQVVTQLFGSLLQAGVLTGSDLAWGLEALVALFVPPKLPAGVIQYGEGPEMRMQAFAIEALRTAGPRLRSWPHLCTSLVALPGLRESARDLWEAAAATVGLPPDGAGLTFPGGGPVGPPPGRATPPPGPQQQRGAGPGGAGVPAGSGAPTAPPPSAPPQGAPPPQGTSSGPGVSLLEREFARQLARCVPPSPALQNRISFGFNNLTMDSLPQRTAEIAEIVGRDHREWFSHYLVVKRASLEVNFIPQYVRLAVEYGRIDKRTGDVAGSDGVDMTALILRTTYHYIRLLLDSSIIVVGPSSAESSAQRTLLKNLGCWLGQLTLARDKPVLFRELSLKQCLWDAYQRGRLIAVMPFVHKVLEGGRQSLLFRPPNPWIQAVLALMVEIYTLGGDRLKLPVRFEVEITMQDYGLKVSDVVPSQSLHSLPRLTEGNPDWVADRRPSTGVGGVRHGAPLAPGGAFGPPQAAKSGATLSAPHVAPPGAGSQIEQAVARIVRQAFRLSPHLGDLVGPLQLSKVVPAALQKAVMGCHGLVERYVAVTSVTVHDLVSKDFAFEPDETRMRAAAVQMTQRLATSLMVINIRDNVRQSIQNLTADALRGAPCDTVTRDKVAGLVAQDNLAMCVKLLEHMALDKAGVEADARLERHFAARREARRLGRPWTPQAALPGVARLPMLLRPRPLALVSHSPYDEFQYKSLVDEPVPAGSAVAGGSAGEGGGGAGGPGGAPLGAAGGPAVSDPTKVGWAPTHAAHQPGGDWLLTLPPLDDESAARLDQRLTAWRSRLEATAAHMPAALATVPFRQLSPTSELRELVAQAPGPAHLMCAGMPHESALIVRSLLQTMAAFDSAPSPPPKQLLHAYGAAAKAIADAAGARGNAPGPANLLYRWVRSIESSPQLPKAALEAVLVAGAVNIGDVDSVIASMISGGTRALAGIECAILVLTSVVLAGAATVADVRQTVDLLLKVAQRHPQGPLLVRLVEEARSCTPGVPGAAAGPVVDSQAIAARMDRGLNLGGGPTGPDGRPVASSPALDTSRLGPEAAAVAWGRSLQGPAREMASFFQRWIGLQSTPQGNAVPKPYDSVTASHLYQTGLARLAILESDKSTDAFLRLVTEMAVRLCLATEMGGRPIGFLAPDAHVMLVVRLIRSGGREHERGSQESSSRRMDNTHMSKVNHRLGHVLSAIAAVLIEDAKLAGGAFSSRPYYRIFVGLMSELTPAQGFDVYTLPTLQAIGAALNALQPLRVPGFAFAWLELVSYRGFMPKLLQLPDREGWMPLLRLLIGLLRFLEPYLHMAQLSDPVRLMYKGTLRTFLVLLHDFPDFLAKHAHSLCAAMPPTCVQLRNLILAAFPRAIRPPDPISATLRVDALPEIVQIPSIDPAMGVAPPECHREVRTAVENCLRVSEKAAQTSDWPDQADQAPAPVSRDIQSAVADIVLIFRQVHLARGEPFTSLGAAAYLSGIATLTLQSAVQLAHTRGRPLALPHLDIVLELVRTLLPEERYLFLNGLANHLRYPNAHMRWASHAILHAFHWSDSALAKEQVTRVLLERLIAQRPHPWGLLVTFIELLKNPTYGLWQQDFTRSSTEVRRLFANVASFLGGAGQGQAVPQGQAAQPSK